MCGIVGAVAQRDVTPILVEGLRRLEYRGYDSAGVVVLNEDAAFERVRVSGKVDELAQGIARSPICGNTGIAHTRWATHGRPSVDNAHPHLCRDEVALVHNGIIENHESLRSRQVERGYDFTSDTDTEVIVNQIHIHLQKDGDVFAAVKDTVAELQGAYALAVISNTWPQRLVAVRRGSPLVIGIGVAEYFLASDVFALLPVTQRFIVLEEGDMADIRKGSLLVYDRDGDQVERPIITSALSADRADKGGYRHYMLKEIMTQPLAIADTLEGRLEDGKIIDPVFAMQADDVFARVNAIHIVACGTSYHAGLIAKYWMESIAGVQCHVEIASEYRYRKTVIAGNTLFLTLSQSGETLDTLEALRLAKTRPYLARLAICNVPESALTRESDRVFLTRAGREVGVASTKAFTTQLVALLMLTLLLARRGGVNDEVESDIARQLEKLPGQINHVLELHAPIATLAEDFVHKHHALFLGRGAMLPVAMEGALKLKEISYIHAEAYAAGELKHGPLALIDDEMPVIAVAPNNALLGKLKANLQEVRARGGRLYVFADAKSAITDASHVTTISIAPVEDVIAPIIYTVPLQLLAYHVAVLKGADVDQPRNLAKSVTVE